MVFLFEPNMQSIIDEVEPFNYDDFTVDIMARFERIGLRE